MGLNESVRKLRRLKNLSQSELGKRVGYSLHTISRIERGQWSGSFKVIRDLANFFGVKPEELDESIKGDIPFLDSPPPELPDFKRYNKATIIETLKPVVPAIKAREEIADRLSGMFNNRWTQQADHPTNQAETKCLIMEKMMGIQTLESLEEILKFVEMKIESEKKIVSKFPHGIDAVQRDEELIR